MEWKAGILAGALAALMPAAAFAQSSIDKGFYVGAGAGASWLGDIDRDNGPNVDIDDPGWAGMLALGYDFGKFRAEVEGLYRNNDIDGRGGRVQRYGALLNLLFDFDFGFPVKPHIGVGAGWVWTDYKHSFKTDDGFVLQGIAGLDYAITPNIAAFVDYRYVTNELITISTDDEWDDHTVLAGLRFTFGQPERPKPTPAVAPPPPPPPPPPVTRPAPPPAPAPVARSYLVFFDFDRSNLTPEARQIVQTAAQNARTASGVTRINVTGHADRSGPASYNLGLSRRRAEAVRAELIRNGIAPNEIAMFAKGETDPLVPTPDGVREPQNRRVEIVFQ